MFHSCTMLVYPASDVLHPEVLVLKFRQLIPDVLEGGFRKLKC